MRDVSWALLPALLLMGCGGEAEDLTATVEALAATGPHGVGYSTFTATYAAPVTDEDRTITVLAWYPAEANPGGDKPLYLLREAELATVDAPPLAGPWPVVVLSHGHQGYPAGMSYLAEHLASHGWLVLAPSHKGNTFADGDNRRTDIYYLRALDLSAALDALAALPASHPAHGLAGDQMAVVGHSFGGYTAYMLAGARHDMDALEAACAAGTGKASFCSDLDAAHAAVFRAGLADSRFSAVVSLDPGDFDLFGAAGVAQVSLPALHMVAEASGHRPGHPEEDAYWQALPGASARRVLLLGGAHNDFTDACAAGLDIQCSELAPAPVWRMIRVYVQAFLQRAVLGDDAVAGILDGEVAVSDLAELTAR
ncbi:MAG: dienelactone hydrolase family protein [Myxococcales bacterium]|nr:dienelactone hydrolase family protein [Myxococcales bacterium]MCB9648806.1 dienelactone hydrolase family protein [Deltaproteobacteria bacterium]